MRDPNRIPEIVYALKKLWEANPDLRLGQLLTNAINPGIPYPELYYIEDNEHVSRLNKLQVICRTNSVFKNSGTAMDWLRTPCHTLGGQIPEMLLDSAEGVELVLSALGRIENGDFS